MDPFSLTAGALQIAGAAAQCTITIIKWVGDVRTVDARISSFCDEVTALQATYEGLERSLSSPLMAEAARVANQTSDGAHLWSQIKEALDDSRRTIFRVNEVLAHIGRSSGFGRKIKTQLAESIASGELSRLRQRIQFFNSALSLPIQMVCVMLQLEQRGMTTENQVALDNKLVALEHTMRALVQSLSAPNRAHTLGGSTVVASSTGDKMLEPDDGMETYVKFATQFLTTASAAASTRSSLSTISPAIEPEMMVAEGKRSLGERSPSFEHHDRITQWISPATTADEPRPRPTGNAMDAPSGSVDLEDDFEVDFLRTKRHLELGQERFEAGNHAGAELHYRKALALMEVNGFDGRISFHPAEVVLMLAECLLKQERLDDAVPLLLPVARMHATVFPGGATSEAVRRWSTTQAADKLQALAASHMLGQVFLLKTDFDTAQEHALKAFTGRRRELGAHDDKTRESVQLVIDIYRAQGDEAEAEGYEIFLLPAQKPRSILFPEPRPIPGPAVPRSVPPLISPDLNAIPLAAPGPRKGRPSFASRLRHFGRSPQSSLAQSPPTSDLQRLSISQSTTNNDDLDFGSPRLDGRRGFSSPSDSSTHERSVSVQDDESVTTPSSGRMERKGSSRTLEPTYLAIAQLCQEKKLDRACKVAMQYLDTYNSNVMVIRQMELKDNLRKGVGRGLARTGRGYAALHFFCELRHECAEEVNLLIKQGVDVNAIAHRAGYAASNPKDAFTALQQATERGHSTITGLLLGVAGIKTDVHDPDGLTPLMVACRKGHHAIVRQLLRFPLPAAFPGTWHGNTLLHDAARRCDPTVVEMLLDHHPDIDARDRFGKTALMHAVIKTDVADPAEKKTFTRGRCQTVMILLEAGADPTLKDYRTELSIRDYAAREDDADLSVLLDQAPRKGVVELLA